VSALKGQNDCVRVLIRSVRAIVGEIRWAPPPWAAWTAGRMRHAAEATAAHGRRRPCHTAAVGVALLCVFGGTLAAWRWYETRPRPVAMEFTVSAPDLTCYSCEPPGKPQPLIVRFSGSAAPLAQSGKDLAANSDAVRMTPAMKGTWHWDDDRVLRFAPAEDWPIGTSFKVRFAHSGFVALKVRLNEYGLEFKSPVFEARITGTEFHQDPVVAADKKVVVSVAFTHPVDPERFEKRISLELFERVTDTMEQKRGKPPFTVVYDKLKLNAYIHSEQLAVPNKAGRLAIRIGAGLCAARGGNQTQAPLEAAVDVPGLYSLSVERMALEIARNERDEPSQALVLEMNHTVIERDMPGSVHAWLLPERFPDPRIQQDFERLHPGAPYPWYPQVVTPDVLAQSEKLPLTQVPGELEHYTLHSFRHGAQPGRFVYVKVDRGLKSFGGYVLAESAERLLQVPEYPRELRIAGQGALLAFSGEKTLTVMTRDVPAMHVEIGRLLPHQIQHLVSQTDGTFSAPTFKNWSFDAADITERFTSTIRLPAGKPGAAHYQAIPLQHYLADEAADRRGIFFIRVEAWDTEHDRPLSGLAGANWNAARNDSLADTRLVVVTDLGLLEKKSLDGSRDLFVQSIHSGDPLGGVRVDILGRNGLTVLSGTTDVEGHVHFADLRSFTREQQPTLYLARRNGDSSFLPIEERDRRLDLSRFDIGGVDNRLDQGTLSAYLFSDRGLYRPGEEFRLGAILRSQDWTRSLVGVPLQLDIVDPRGVNVRREPFTPGPAGFAEIRYTTRDSSPAGSYTVSLSMVRAEGRSDLIGSTTVQVRDFLPDRLRMSTHFSAENAEGWVSPESLSASVGIQNLFGTPAAKRRVTARMSLSPALPAFRGFADYQFYDPEAARQGFEEALSAATTDEKGEASFDLGLQRFARATYRVHVATEGFEADGGRGVSSEAAQLVSSLPYLVGWKPDGPLGFVARDARRSIELITIDPHLRKTEVKNLKLTRLETRYISTLIRENNGTYRYESRRKDVTLEERELSVLAEGLALPLATDAPGSFAYVVTDGEGQRLARIEYHVAGNANLTRSLEKDAQLQITLARSDYAAGEEIEMQIQAPYTGAGLITIERDRVYAWRWFRTDTTSSTQRIKLPEGIEGNAYIEVAFIRDPGSEEIYASPLSYGVQPFSINLDARRDAVHLEVPALVKPGDTVKLGYSTARPSRIVVFAVDEGILQVAGYRAPDPLAHFFQKRMLEVSTAQILDLILPEFRRGGLDAAAGGDRGSALGRHLNPFRRKGDKPVAFWSGVLDADGTRREAEYVVPEYFNGTLRIIAVAVSDEAVGVAQASTIVRGDLVLSPNAPTTVTPGDEFEVSVGVANNLVGSGPDAQLTVELKPGAALELVGAGSARLVIAESHEGVAVYRLRAREKLGAASLEFIASSGATAIRRHIDLSVRPATPYMTTLIAGTLKSEAREVRVERDLHPEYRSLEAGISLVPLSLAHGLVIYLAHYPYACTEQIVSQAMPALVLSDRPEFGYVNAQPGADIRGLLNELRVRQNDEGAYKLWPGGNQVVEFVSLYAQHFLIEASSRSQQVPLGLVDSGNAYLRAIAARDGNNLADERDSAYAIYLLTRQGSIMAAETSALRKRLTERYRGAWEQDLAAVWLASSLKLMRQDRDAVSLIARLKFGEHGGADLYDDDMTRDGFLLYALARHFPERLPDLPPQALENLAARINANSYHSLSAGTTLLALDAYAKATHAERAPRLSIAEVLRDGKVRPLELPAGLIPSAAFGADARALKFTSGTDFNAFYLVSQSGFDRMAPKEPVSMGFEILREYTDHAGHAVAQIKMGDEVDVHLKFRALNDRARTEVALVDLLPGGFDLAIPPAPAADRLYRASPKTLAAAEVDSEETVDPGEAGDSEPQAVSDSAQYGWPGRAACPFCSAASSAELHYVDPREDRVVFYATLTRDVREVVFRIKATNAGLYTVPPAYGEAMYDRGVLARSAAGRVEVVKP
jgi:alpha-2-macroglobulin